MLNDKAQQTAFKLLDKFGKVGTYKRKGGQIYDPETGGMTEQTSEYKVKAYIDSIKSYLAPIERGLINEGNVVILIAAKSLPFMPQNNDLIEFPHCAYTIKYNDAVWGGEDVALHQLIGVAK
ncbi:hypothetical protein [Campylobacter showae]|uniref:Phage protein n=1 Tax=Campylobacter showae CC57C TaxID=1073353 RepID=M3JBP1_9BACT|nr:hypothetical protein [Campylobacter showae]EMG30077.1 hypothetical protein H740_08231 [Campylobacter showae CC57C]